MFDKSREFSIDIPGNKWNCVSFSSFFFRKMETSIIPLARIAKIYIVVQNLDIVDYEANM